MADGSVQQQIKDETSTVFDTIGNTVCNEPESQTVRRLGRIAYAPESA